MLGGTPVLAEPRYVFYPDPRLSHGPDPGPVFYLNPGPSPSPYTVVAFSTLFRRILSRWWLFLTLVAIFDVGGYFSRWWLIYMLGGTPV